MAEIAPLITLDARFSDPSRHINSDILSLLRRSAASGVAERQNQPHGLPPISYGMIQWAFTNKAIRDELEPLGWEVEYPDNQPRIYSPDRTLAIVTSSGDSYVGDVTRKASKRNLGPASLRSERQNQLMQTVLHGYGTYFDESSQPLALTATLLYLNHEQSGELRMELTFLGSEFCDSQGIWHNRTVLEPITLNPDFEFMNGVDNEPDVDFDVSARQ